MSHPLSPDQMQMEMEHGLSPVEARIRNETVAALFNAFRFCKFPCGGEEMADQLFILRFERVDRFDVLVRDDQDVRRCNGVNVAESGHLVIPVHNGGFRFV